MGTSTLFRRWNDWSGRLSEMSKEELKNLPGKICRRPVF